MLFKIIKSERGTGFVVLSKEVGESSTHPVKINQVSSYQDERPYRWLLSFQICIYYHHLTLLHFKALL